MLLASILLVLFNLGVSEAGASEQIKVLELSSIKFIFSSTDSLPHNRIHNLGIWSERIDFGFVTKAVAGVKRFIDKTLK